VWLQRLLYPEPPDDDDDDSGSEEVGEVRLEVRRQHLLQDSYEQVREPGACCLQCYDLSRSSTAVPAILP
jgi:hypothetical protein